jgi:hypothetical protein
MNRLSVLRLISLLLAIAATMVFVSIFRYFKNSNVIDYDLGRPDSVVIYQSHLAFYEDSNQTVQYSVFRMNNKKADYKTIEFYLFCINDSSENYYNQRYFNPETAYLMSHGDSIIILKIDTLIKNSSVIGCGIKFKTV